MAGNGDCPLMQKRLTEKPSTETKNGGCQIRRGGKQVLRVSAENLGYGHLKLSGFEAWGEAKELACQPDSRAAAWAGAACGLALGSPGHTRRLTHPLLLCWFYRSPVGEFWLARPPAW